MNKGIVLTFWVLLIISNSILSVPAQESDLHYSADLRTGNTFRWRVDLMNVDYFVDGKNLDPTNIIYSYEATESGILFFPPESNIPVESNGSIYELTVNQDIDVISSFDQIILNFNFSLELDNTLLSNSVNEVDVSKPLFNFFMQPSLITYGNGTTVNYLQTISTGSTSFQNEIDNRYSISGFYPTRLSSLQIYISEGIFVYIERFAECIEETNQPQTCDSVDSFYEYGGITKLYDVTSGKLLFYSYSEERIFDENDRLFPSIIKYNLTNIDTTTGKGPIVNSVANDNKFEIDIPIQFILGGIVITGIFIIILFGFKLRGKEI